MSTHSLISRRQRGQWRKWNWCRGSLNKRAGKTDLRPVFILPGFLFVLQLWFALSSTAFASTRLSGVPPQPPEDITRAGVSVVRLLVSYTNQSGGTPVAECSGLGVLVASWPAQTSAENNNWILTDGKLVNTGTQATCAPSHPTAKFASVQINLSNEYNPQPISFTVKDTSIRCRDNPCDQGPVLIAFNIDAQHPEPHIDLAATNAANTGTFVGLTQSSDSFSMPTPFVTDIQQMTSYVPQIQNYRTPKEIPANGSPELGTPMVNQTGELVGMHLSAALLSAADIQSFMNTMTELSAIHPANAVHDNWNKGMDAYYQKDFSTARTAFLAAAKANPEFQAANNYATLSASAPPPVKANSNSPVANAKPGGLSFDGIQIPYWVLIIFGLVVLVGLLLITSVRFGRSRVLRKRMLKSELAEAERRAAVDAQHIAEMEAAQRAWTQTSGPAQQDFPSEPPVPISSGPLTAPALRCPRCGEVVPRDANYCSNCRLLLSPTESGLHLRVRPEAPSAPAVPPTPAAPTSPSSLSTLPTTPLIPAGSIAEQPTLQMLPETKPESNRNGKSDTEKTIPYTVQQLKGDRLGFAVGTRSDPGIRRKYRPNEDSLFAAQGLVNAPSSPLKFGLFVIADGMGGHAKGQDASRLAVQTIIDYMLPRLMSSGVLPHDEYVQLLVNGIQSANQAVHQHNMDQHGDMGTTVTGSLLVGTTAYVANVGDSRTYLYRQDEGLKKVTNDHSVVASLVEAGIIKPDDIYTHPKRNQIYRSLGEKPDVEIDSFVVHLQTGDKLLLCSDGLWDMVRDPKIEEVIKAPVPNPSTTGDALIQAALEGGGEDNVSVIVVHITEDAMMPTTRIQLLAKPDSVQMPHLQA